MRNVNFKKLVLGTALAVATSGVVGVMANDAAWAQRANRNTQEQAPTEGRQFSAKAGQTVSEANELLSADNYGAAIAKLQEAISLSGLNPYERSIIYQMTGAAYYQQNNTAQAMSNFENAINAGGLLPKEVDSLRVNIAQLMIGNGQYSQGAQMIEDWNRRGGQMNDQLIKTVMQAWIQAENYSRALPWAERWFNSLSSKSEQDFNTMNFLYNSLNMPGKQADIVKQMIARWPEQKKYWDAWTSMLANGGREKDAFEVRKMLYLGGVLSKESDLLQIVQYYSFYEMPFQAAQILEREMNAGRIQKTTERYVQLSDLWRQSREYKRAIPVLETAAAQAGTPKSYADLGEAYYNEKQCDKAQQSFSKAVSLGYDAGKAQMLTATCLYEKAQEESRLTCKMSTDQRNATARVKLRSQARSAFQKVPASSREGRNAKKWLNFIKAEEKAFNDRCEFEATVEKEQCFIAIRSGYKSIVFTGGELEVTEQCSPYVAAYDAEFRKTVDSSKVPGEE